MRKDIARKLAMEAEKAGTKTTAPATASLDADLAQAVATLSGGGFKLIDNDKKLSLKDKTTMKTLSKNEMVAALDAIIAAGEKIIQYKNGVKTSNDAFNKIIASCEKVAKGVSNTENDSVKPRYTALQKAAMGMKAIGDGGMLKLTQHALVSAKALLNHVEESAKQFK